MKTSCVAFLDNENALESVQTQAKRSSSSPLHSNDAMSRLCFILVHILLSWVKAIITTITRSRIRHNLFTATVESVIRRLEWTMSNAMASEGNYFSTVESLLYDHHQNHIGVVVYEGWSLVRDSYSLCCPLSVTRNMVV